jgi:hypothetical protein
MRGALALGIPVALRAFGPFGGLLGSVRTSSQPRVPRQTLALARDLKRSRQEKGDPPLGGGRGRLRGARIRSEGVEPGPGDDLKTELAA